MPGVIYEYTLEVLNFNGPSDISDGVYRSACTVPQYFTGLQVQSTSSIEVSLSWRQPVDDGSCTIQGYQLWRDDGALGDFIGVDTDIGASTFSYSVTGLTPSQSYRFKVVAYNEIGATDSNIVSSIIADVPATPTVAPDFNAEETTTDSIRVVMASVPDDGGSPVISYHLQRTESGGSAFFDVTGEEGNYNLNAEV